MNIRHYWLIIKRRCLPTSLVFVSVLTGTVVALALQEDMFEAKGKIRFTGIDRTSALTGLSGDETSGFTPLVEDNNPMTTEMEVIRSVPIIQTVLERLQPPEAEAITQQQLLENLQLHNPKGTDILQVVYQDADPARAKAIVDTVMQVYLENHIQANRTEAIAAREFIERELPAAEASVHEAEANLRAFQEAYQTVALENEKGAVVTAAEDLRRRIVEAQSELAGASEQSVALSQQLGMNPQEAIAVTVLSQSPGVQEVLTAMQEVETQLAAERVRYEDASPTVQALLSRRANLQSLVNQRIADTLDGQPLDSSTNYQIGELKATLAGDLAHAEVQRLALARQVAALTQAENLYARRIASFPRLEQEQRELMRRLEAAQATYSLLLQRFHETRVAENQNVGNARILQQAFVSEQPVAPSQGSFLATGAMLASLLAVATALALESQDKLIKTVGEAKHAFGLTSLGLIPLHSVTGKISDYFGEVPPSAEELTPEVVVKYAPRSVIAESYRMLQANLTFVAPDRTLKTLVVTSSVVGEGKSLVSANLAMTFAQQGHRVLLIDADMRCPRQHQIWNLVNDTGLSNAIAEHLQPETVIKTPAGNLDVLTAGVLPPNPAALLDSQRTAELLRQFANSYDFVVMDTPALTMAVDMLILGKISDGILLVTRPGVVDVDSATVARERLEQSGQWVLGQVINGVIPEYEPDSYYYFTGTYSERKALASRVPHSLSTTP